MSTGKRITSVTTEFTTNICEQLGFEARMVRSIRIDPGQITVETLEFDEQGQIVIDDGVPVTRDAEGFLIQAAKTNLHLIKVKPQRTLAQ